MRSTWFATTTFAAAHAFCRPLALPRRTRLWSTVSVAHRSLSLKAATTTAVEDAIAVDAEAPTRRVPVTLLSGFLGAGKTTLLRHVLDEAQANNRKIGVVVNDMASVNIDSKLVRSPLGDGEVEKPSAGEFVELGDGCICCTMSDELFATLGELVAIAYVKGFEYDHMVVEATGVAEPRLIRDQFQDAEFAGIPLMDAIQLDTLVTVVDSSTFLDAYAEKRSVAERPELIAAPDNTSAILMARYDGSLQRAVVDLLVEQVECADVVLLNKADLVEPAKLEELRQIIKALNGDAKIIETAHGVTPLDSVLAASGGLGSASLGPVDEHKAAVAASKAANCAEVECTDPTHDHDHSGSHAKEQDCADTACTDPTHDHGHSGSHAKEEACADTACTDPTHDHGHSGAHAAEEACADTACTDPTHDHGHSGSHAKEEDCADTACTDPTHDHSHSGSHAPAKTTAQERFGIESFVYSRRRPFDPSRVEKLLAALPADTSASLSGKAPAASDDLALALAPLLRSKGFMWIATSHDVAYYWSHAGANFVANVLGRWWATVPEDRWPEDQIEAISSDFDGEYGDRRNEIVFIGLNINKNKEAIELALDDCLLTDDEFKVYMSTGEEERANVFPSNVAKPNRWA